MQYQALNKEICTMFRVKIKYITAIYRLDTQLVLLYNCAEDSNCCIHCFFGC